MFADDFLSNLLTANTTVRKVLELLSICRHTFSEIDFVTSLFFSSSYDVIVINKDVRDSSFVSHTLAKRKVYTNFYFKNILTCKGELY
jgi:hypothetical protein